MPRLRRLPSLFALVLAVVAGLGAGSSVRADTPPNMLVMAMAMDDIISLDPAEVFEFSGAEADGNLYDRLFRANPDDPAEPIPEALEGWSVSDDGQRFTLAVRPGITFHSGNPLTAEDVVFSLHRAVILNKAPAFILTQFGWTPERLDQQVRAAGPMTVELLIERPLAPSLVVNALSAGVSAVVDKQLLLEHQQDGDLGNAWLKTHDAGSGPFSLRAWNAGEFLMLDAFPDYWDGAPKMQRVVVRDIREASTQRLLLENGDIDIARNIGPDQAKGLAGNPDIETRSAANGRIFYLGLNQKNPTLAKPEVREALRWLVDYQGIADRLLEGRAEVRQVFLPRGMFGAIDDAPFSPDLAKAKALLAEAGVGDGFAVTMDTRSTTPTIEVAQALQASFAEAGISLEIIPGDGKQTLTKYRARRHDIYIGAWGPDYLDPHSNAVAFASNPDNSDDSDDKSLAWRNAWDIPELTAETAAAKRERDLARRVAMYADLQRAIQADSPFVIMFQERDLIALRKGVEGFKTHLLSGSNVYKNVTK